MNKIGIDLRSLQIGHQYRGIGEVVRQITRRITELTDDSAEFVYYQYDEPRQKEVILEITKKINIGATVTLPRGSKKLDKLLSNGMTSVQESIIKSTCDMFVQFDFELGLPRNHKNILIVHDQIPYLFGNRYPHSYHSEYKMARKAGLSKKHAMKKDIQRRLYKNNFSKVLDRASIVLSVSNYTKQTTATFSNRPLDIRVMHLGHDVKSIGEIHLTALEKLKIHELGIDHRNFLFFIGGVDERRRIDELVHAYNQLRADGYDIHLALAGYDFQSIDHIYSPRTRRAIEQSSYKDQIHLMGFVSNTEREWLYENALSFVFPTEAEGFGIPLIESLSVGCPVIAYDKTAIKELAGPNVYLASGWKGIHDSAKEIINLPPSELKKNKEQGVQWARDFSWDNSAAVLSRALKEL